MGVTRIFEKIEEGIKNQQAEISGVKKMVLDWAQRQALHHHNQEMSGQPHFSLGYKLAQKMVFKKVILIYIVNVWVFIYFCLDSPSSWF